MSLDLSWFTSPRDEAQLKRLDAEVGALDAAACTERDCDALLAVFERFPTDDGYGVFWSILHCLERCPVYAPRLVASVEREPVELNVTMIGRLLNGGTQVVNGMRLTDLLTRVAKSESAARETAASFLRAAKPRT